ncbi:hypothetical protein PTD2_04958, partial [Pseudoalteromonas tunicata D2]
IKVGVPKGIRTPVTAVKGRCPRPLDDGDTVLIKRVSLGHYNQVYWWSYAGSNRRPLHCQRSALPAEL